jgi:hypothetical protein
MLSWHITVGIECGEYKYIPYTCFEVSCSFVQLRNTFYMQGSARALVRVEI